jgi:hypothetical protein
MSEKWLLTAAQHPETGGRFGQNKPNIRSGVITRPVAGLTSA